MNIRHKKYKILLFLTLACALLIPSIAIAEDSSIVGDFYNKVFNITLNNGHTIIDTSESDYKRKEINNQIYKNEATKTYSLYDRFGGNLIFYPYLGEIKISTTLLDKYYEKIKENDPALELGDIPKLFEPNAISNNVVYEGRPDVLSFTDLLSGKVDPRLAMYARGTGPGGFAALGNMFLFFSNFITPFIGWLTESSLFKLINDIWQYAMNSGIQDFIRQFVDIYSPLFIAIFVIGLVFSCFRVIRGAESASHVFMNVGSVIISLGIVFSLSYNPSATSNFFYNFVNLIDNTFNKVLTLDSSEIVKSDNPDNIRTAALWEHTVFRPWCKGMFGRDYDEMYTQFDETHSVSQKMPQSNDDVSVDWEGDEIRYNSVELTGDIVVPLGNNVDVRNWAALAYSIQSIYHIDAVQEEDSQETNSEEIDAKSWPRAELTPKSDSIYCDNFRLIDALLDISPEYRSATDITNNYTGARVYNPDFIFYGFVSFWNSLLIIPFMILGFRKTVCALKIIISGVRLMIYSIGNIIMPNRYNILDNLKKFALPLFDYFWWSLIIFLGLSLFDVLANVNMLNDLLWIVLAIILCKAKPIHTPRQLAYAKRKAEIWIDSKKSQAKQATRSGIENITKYINK